MLTVEGINVSYGDVQILREISFTVGQGEIVTLVGSNGAGKTTCIRAISGLILPSTGRILFQDKEIQGLAPHEIVERGVVQIPEGRKLWPQMSVYENLILGSYVSESRKKRKEHLDSVFDVFPKLKERQHQLAGTLSGGEQQMLAIGRGLMASPKLLMFDEPSLGLAPILIEEMFRVITAINAQGITVLLVEQNLHRSLEIAHRAYVLETGRITIQGKSCDLLNNEHIKKAYLGL